MKEIYRFFGRGIGPATDPYRIECEEGTVLIVTQTFGAIEMVMGYCRTVIVDPWGINCIDPFRRASDVACTRSWAEPEKSGITIFRPVRLHLAAEEPWMHMRY